MKKNIIIAIATAALVLAASCQKTPYKADKGYGYLSFGEFTLGLDESVETKATSAASGNYTITIYDADGNDVIQKSYSEIKNNDNKISIPAGAYTLVARSSDELPVAAFEQPVYGVSKEFTIEAGMETQIGELVCTLLQCKVTVAYSEEFLANVTGTGATTVEVSAGSPLVYALDADKSYDQSAGYFVVNEGCTMTVVFKGSFEGKTKTMTKSFTGIAARQWRQIKFIQKVNEQGTATFDIVIQDLVSDEILNDDIQTEEAILGEDPEAPKGDGGIALALDYEAGCDPEITDLENILIVPVETRDMAIRFKATVPNGVKKFTVNIDSDNDSFLAAVDAANARELNLISPLAENAIIFEVVPFPHGDELIGMTEISFNLDAAQDAIQKYKGRHTFLMSIVDQTGCKNQIPVVMVVE